MNFDVIVIGAGVIGCSVAYHAAALGAKRVLLVDRRGIAEGTTSQSSGILRTHYSVAENVELARRSFAVFDGFADYLDDPEADCGLVRCGYLIVADGRREAAVRASLAAQRARGIDAAEIGPRDALALLPLLAVDDLTVFGYEPEAGFADAYLTATAFARAARRRGAVIRTGTTVTGLLKSGPRITGIRTADGDLSAGVVVSAMNVWSGWLERFTGVPIPVVAERHEVVAFEAPEPYRSTYPVLKDMASSQLVYARSYGNRQLLASPGLEGEPVDPDADQGDVSLDFIATLGEQVAARLPVFGEAGVASSWTGLYDVTPDWNPVIGPLPGVDGLIAAFGFSGHGFKLSPAVGRLLAQQALGLATDVPLSPYRFERFAEGRLLTGRYGRGAVS